MLIILDNPTTFLEFKKELRLQYSVENGRFYDEYRNCEKMLLSQQEADDIAGKELRRFEYSYVASGSNQELNIPHKMKKEFQELVKAGSNDFGILAPIKDEVVKMMVNPFYSLMISSS